MRQAAHPGAVDRPRGNSAQQLTAGSISTPQGVSAGFLQVHRQPRIGLRDVRHSDENSSSIRTLSLAGCRSNPTDPVYARTPV